MIVHIDLKKTLADTSIHDDNNNNNNAVSMMQNSVVCPICKSNNVITDPESGEIVCSKCGRVISDKIQEIRQESRTFLNTEQAKDRRRPTSLVRGSDPVLVKNGNGINCILYASALVSIWRQLLA
ncbi:MAG: TFIIB-type zinc ribbon-containing protein [Candidatus Nitrosopolaris sp.]